MTQPVYSGPQTPDAPAIGGSSRGQPVVLATLAVPFEPEAARVAIQAALESHVKLVVVDAVEMPLWHQCLTTRRAELELDEDRQEIRRLVGDAHGLGLQVEHLRVRSPRPVDALLEVVEECNAGLLVLGPDPARLTKRLFTRAVRKIRKRALCLTWIAGEGP